MTFAREAWFGPLAIDGLQLADGDLAVGGEPLARAAPELVQATLSTVTERRLAAAWLSGDDELYSEGSLNT